MRNGTNARRRSGGGFLETIKTMVYAVLIAVAVRTFLYEPFNIPSSSMVPTLLIGDYLFVSKFSYGYSKHSLPFSIPLFSGRILEGEPERGDVAVFKLPRDNKTDYIKRIIGLPGDRIQVIGGILHINGEPVQRERLAEDYVYDGKPHAQYIETLPGGRQHRIVEVGDGEFKDNTNEFVVPAGHYFGMGDNRDNSDDSRGGVGFIPAENLVGRAEILFFSTDGSAELWEFWKWPQAIRWDRLFDGVR
jgi:signal peptidase I